MHIVDLGLMDYKQALTLQDECVQKALAGGPETILLVEHPPVVTLGRNADAAKAFSDEQALWSSGIEVVRTGRGGQATCHYPGQLVVYPIMRIGKDRGGIRGHVRLLEDIILQTVATWGVGAQSRPGTAGVWTDNGKLASIGVAVKRAIAYHGFSINVAADVTLFRCINPCGEPGAPMASLEDECRRRRSHSAGSNSGVALPSMKEVKHVCAEISRRAFASAQAFADSTSDG